ncbi:septum formation initiator family protein [Candidatus Parcubacteria bacterium]|nr:MAG: septum formation initiator family protein [Candidatus Parcubacteria bacterium]
MIKKTKPAREWHHKIFDSNIFTIFLVLLLILSFVKVTKEVMLRYEINKEIKILESQLASIEGKTGDMEKLISYLNTDEYIEKQARLKLNLSKPGEKQINLTNSQEISIDFADDEDAINPVKWFNYFFK